MAPTTTNWLDRALAGHILADTGFLTKTDRALLDKAVRRGTLCKWRGHWAPTAGAPYGFGPPKTCYGTPEAKALVNP